MREDFSYYKIFVQGGDAVATAWVAESEGGRKKERGGGGGGEVVEGKSKESVDGWMESARQVEYSENWKP